VSNKLALLLAAAPVAAQVCTLSVAGLNRERRVTGEIATECPAPLHSAPFGNWGVTSNFGPKRDGHQFQGWCRDSRVCDNNGSCRTECRDGWYEWNSCTTRAEFRPPNCTLYNAEECTSQVSTQGINVMGTQTVAIRVRCPIDTNNDGTADAGGCTDVKSYTHGSNFMSVYELDPVTGDQLVQSLYFPPTPVNLNCTVGSCPPTGSEWTRPFRWESPEVPAKVHAEMAMVVNSGTFSDPAGACRVLLTVASTVSAASFQPVVAPDSLATVFGAGLTDSTPARVFLTGADGARHSAGILYSSPGQINFVVPATVTVGEAALAVESGLGTRAIGAVRLAAVAPAIFTADGSGRGNPAALVQRGSEFTLASEPVVVTAETYLHLYGTGIRGGRQAVVVRIGGVEAPLLYAGPQPEFPGLDQVNVRIPQLLAGRGAVTVELTVFGVAANPVVLVLR